MFNIDYTYLNDKLLTIIELLDNTYFLNNLNIIENFINKNKDILSNYDLNENDKIIFQPLDLYATYKIVNNYINTYLKEYKEIINTRINDGSINFSFLNDSSFSYCTYDNNHYDIFIELEHNVKDPGIIIHEIIHSLNIKNKCPNETELMFSEAISIFFELDIYNYMNKLGYNINISNMIKNHIINTNNTINLLEDTIKLIKIISTKGFINENTFDQIKYDPNYNFYDKLSFDYYLYNFQYFFENVDTINLINGFSYILGNTLSISIPKNDTNRKKYKILNNRLSNIELEDAFNILEINIYDNDNTYKNYETELKKCFIKKK